MALDTPSALGPALAGAFLAGPWTRETMVVRGRAALSERPPWLRDLVAAVLDGYHRPPADRPRELARFVVMFLVAREALPCDEDWTWDGDADPFDEDDGPDPAPHVVRWTLRPAVPAPGRWPVAELDGVDDLAALLGLDDGTLSWLADARSLERRVDAEPLRNYRYRAIDRGHGRMRVIEAPKARLKAAQRTVLREILAAIPPHDAAHGFVGGRSARTHAAAHTGRRVVLRFDVEDFFAAVTAPRIYGVFRMAGYTEGVAHTLAALVTNVVPVRVWGAIPRPTEPRIIDAHHRLGRRLAAPHLPQGAPTSPAVANLCAFALDRRLTGLATSVGARYTRYADDLVLSGDEELLRRAVTVRTAVSDIAADEGFRLQKAKTSLMPRAGRQRVTGIVVNVRPNVARTEYDRLRALLHNAARTGPEAQNREGRPDFRAHVLGRIGWVASLHPERGRRLRARFDAIDWT